MQLVLKIKYFSLLIFVFFGFHGVWGQSINLLLGSNNTCNGVLEVGIYVNASQFSTQDFKIGSSSIFIDYNPSVVNLIEYDEHEFSLNMNPNNGWLEQKIDVDSECGLINLVLQLEDKSKNNIYINKQIPTKIGQLNFNILDPTTDPSISVRPEFTSFHEAASNDGSIQIPVIKFPKVLDYSCLENCMMAPEIVSINVQGEDCFSGALGAIELAISDNPDRDSVELSINGGISYEYLYPDDIGNIVFSNFTTGFYDFWIRWQNDECPTQIGIINVPVIGGPQVTANVDFDCNAQGLSGIRFTFPNQLPVINSIRFSIDGGFSYSPVVADHTGSYQINDLPVGQYHCFTSWGDGSCVTDLGVLDVLPPDVPTVFIVNEMDCINPGTRSQLALTVIDNLLYNDIEIILESNSIELVYDIEDNAGTVVLNEIPTENYKVYAKWKNIDCKDFIGTFSIRPANNNYDYAIESNNLSCSTIPTGEINIFIEAQNQPLLSIDGGITFKPPNISSNQYNYPNLVPGTYHIMIDWNSCIEYKDYITIKESGDCPSCVDGILNGDEEYVDCGGTFCVPCSTCEDEKTVNANLITNDLSFNANQWIEIKGTVASGLTVDVNAGEYILMKPQFEVSINSVFNAFIQDCN